LAQRQIQRTRSIFGRVNLTQQVAIVAFPHGVICRFAIKLPVSLQSMVSLSCHLTSRRCAGFKMPIDVYNIKSHSEEPPPRHHDAITRPPLNTSTIPSYNDSGYSGDYHNDN
jgi:hypothetical protein